MNDIQESFKVFLKNRRKIIDGKFDDVTDRVYLKNADIVQQFQEDINNIIIRNLIEDDILRPKIQQMVEDINTIKGIYVDLFNENMMLDIENDKSKLEEILKNNSEIYSIRNKKCRMLKEIIRNKCDDTNNLKEAVSYVVEFLDNDDVEYTKIFDEYIKFQNIENRLKFYTVQIWQKELTHPDNYGCGKPFKFVIHSLTRGGFKPEDIGSRNIISTSLITDKHLGVYCSNYGFIYPIYNENLILIGKEDLQANDFKGDFFQFKDFIGNQQINKDYYLTYNNDYSSQTMTPEQLEQDSISRNIDENGEILNNDTKKTYNEILLINNGINRPIAIFCITNGDREFNKEYEYAKELAEEFNLKLIEIDKTLYRDKQELDMFTPKEKKKVIANLDNRCWETWVTGLGNIYMDMRSAIAPLVNQTNYETTYNYELFEMYENICKQRKGAMDFNKLLMQEMKYITEKYKKLMQIKIAEEVCTDSMKIDRI